MNDSNLLLSIIQLLHFFIDACCMSYIFLFNPLYDIYYILFLFGQTLHWFALKNECIVSYIEKKLINPKYELGENPRWVPHNKVYHNKFTILAKAVLILGSLTIITLRNRQNYIKYICISAAILWVYLTYFYRNPK